MITKMRYVSITVTDLNQAMDFYGSKLGFRVLVEMPLPGNNRFVMVAPPAGGSNLVFSLPLPGRTHSPSTSISFETEDVQATFEQLKAKGVEFPRLPAKTPWGGVEAQFVDPFGNSFLLNKAAYKSPLNREDLWKSHLIRSNGCWPAIQPFAGR